MVGSEEDDMAQDLGTQIYRLAKVIHGMRYDALSEVGRQLYQCVQEEDDGKKYWNLDDRRDWAEMLHSWSEGNLPSEDDQ